MSPVRLKYAARLNCRTLSEETSPGRRLRYIDIEAVGPGVLIESPTEMTFGEAPSRARRLVAAGDTIVSTVRTYLRAIWPVTDPSDDLVVSTGFAVVTPGKTILPCYLAWALQASSFVEEVVARSVGVSYPAINPSELGDIGITLPSIERQRAVCDHLDRETTRIDKLVAAKERLHQLLEDRLQAELDDRIWAGHPRTIQLARVARRIDVGIAEAATHAYADVGIPLLRSTNIRANGIDVKNILYIEPWFADRNRSKTIRMNDILTVRTGNTGVSALVPQQFDGAQCFTQLITTIRAPNVAAFYCYALNSGPTRAYFRSVGWGSAQDNISVPLLSRAPVPLVEPTSQQIAVAAIRRAESRVTLALALLRRQMTLLAERRRALITAAVNDQVPIFNVP